MDPAAVARLRAESLEAEVQPTEFWSGAQLIIAIVSILLACGMMMVVWAAHLPFTGAGGVVQIAFFTGFGSIVVFMLLAVIPASIAGICTQWRTFWRAQRFATENSMTYMASEDGRDRQGALFTMHGSKPPRAGNVFRSTQSPGFEVVGHYRYSREKEVAHWGYVAMDLGRPLPHLILRDGRRRRVHRHFLSEYSDSSTLPLPGVQSQRFVLYGGSEAAAEANSVFDDTLLSRLARLGRGIDAETIGTYLFVYSSRPFNVPRPKVVRSLFETVDIVLEKRQ